MADRPPRLFIYFRHRIKVIQPMMSWPNPVPNSSRKFIFVPRNELWITGIGPDAMVQHAIAKTFIEMWDRHFIALMRGCAWTAIICSTPGALAFRPPYAPKESELLIPVDLINRVYDMANRVFIHTANMCR